MDLKDVLTPLVTLAARFTLRNEISKKALEIRTARLESIAAECSDVLTELLNYAGTVAHQVEIQFRMAGEAYGMEMTPSDLRIPVSALDHWIDESNRTVDPARLRHCRHQLAFHRPDEVLRWDQVVLPLIGTLNDFMMISMPGEPMRDMKGMTRNGIEALEFRKTVNEQMLDVGQFRKALTALLLSAEFVPLTRPSPSLAGQFIAWCRIRCNF
ncbi:MAG: hypothetical protein PW844_06785 [Pantoea sp.]|uniref:hypothetical protein n=1 Tax=Pantoea sp. TaxID=69393 RepID=UPI002387C65A|nr:hypothetical protein [Pantoea sp.]MDE1186169.1 hypothetical protein [Pantoea sp.]